jgi:hypothetical protein
LARQRFDRGFYFSEPTHFQRIASSGMVEQELRWR